MLVYTISNDTQHLNFNKDSADDLTKELNSDSIFFDLRDAKEVYSNLSDYYNKYNLKIKTHKIVEQSGITIKD